MTLSQQRDITVTINHFCPEEYSIDFVSQIEESVDEALRHIGFTRSSTEKGDKGDKGDKVELVYYQFGRVL